MDADGFMTKLWGPGMWESLLYIAFAYPVNPTDVDKQKYKSFFELLGYVLPCKMCQESYKMYITEGDTKITDDIFNNRTTLTKWLYTVHEKVNKKLGVEYGLTYEDVSRRYTAYNLSKTPLQLAAIKDCAILSRHIVDKFVNFAKTRGIPEDELYILNQITPALWARRNKECSEIMFDMKINAKPSIETEGEYKGLPTKDELRLIVRMSTNLSSLEISHITKKLCPNKRIFKLVF
jgi:hypothetical protein